VKWQVIKQKFKKEVLTAKKNYYENISKDLRMSNPSRWYSMLKRICSYDQHKSIPVIVESINYYINYNLLSDD
jgi:hypothetical protein